MKYLNVLLLFCILIVGCSVNNFNVRNHANHIKSSFEKSNPEDYYNVPSKLELLSQLEKDALHKQYNTTNNFSENVLGVKTMLHTDEKVIALTLDACGGEYGSGYDETLIDFLIAENIKATIFVNARWIDANMEEFLQLASNPLFTIENHGTEHKPLSIRSNYAWGIQSTTSQEEVVNEIMGNQVKITKLTGYTPRYFRSGTAYYDEASVKIANDLNLEVVNFSINGDAGATFSQERVKQSLLHSTNGSIVILHMNQPNSNTAAGVKEAIPILISQGYEFVHLSDYELK